MQNSIIHNKQAFGVDQLEHKTKKNQYICPYRRTNGAFGMNDRGD